MAPITTLFTTLLAVTGTALAAAPEIQFKPYAPAKAIPASKARTKTCKLTALGGGQDDSANILAAINKCNYGGSVVFTAGQSFTIGTAMDLSNLHDLDLVVDGNITFTNNTSYWQAHSFKIATFQNVPGFFSMSGNDVNMYGPGVINGNGQAWYDLYAANSSTLRPVMFGILGLHNSRFGPLNLLNSPEYYHFVANSSGIVFDSININTYSTSSHGAANTDGWDTYRSDNIVIQNSHVVNDDDCVSFKPNSTNMLVQNMYCNGSHGISVGSLGQYIGEIDIVENVYVYNISMNNAQNGARIKVWPGIPSALSSDLQGGGGSGAVRNITFDTFTNYNVDYPIDLTGCYGQNNFTLCQANPSNITMTNILFHNINGVSSKKYAPVSGYMVCSSDKTCKNVRATDINLKSPNGTVNDFQCGNIKTKKIQANCQLPPGFA